MIRNKEKLTVVILSLILVLLITFPLIRLISSSMRFGIYRYDISEYNYNEVSHNGSLFWPQEIPSDCKEVTYSFVRKKDFYDAFLMIQFTSENDAEYFLNNILDSVSDNKIESRKNIADERYTDYLSTLNGEKALNYDELIHKRYNIISFSKELKRIVITDTETNGAAVPRYWSYFGIRIVEPIYDDVRKNNY